MDIKFSSSLIQQTYDRVRDGHEHISHQDVSNILLELGNDSELSLDERADLRQLIDNLPRDAFVEDSRSVLEGFMLQVKGRSQKVSAASLESLNTIELQAAFRQEVNDRAFEIKKNPALGFEIAYEYGVRAKTLSARMEPEESAKMFRSLEKTAMATVLIRYADMDRDRDTMSDLHEALRGEIPVRPDERSSSVHKTWNTTYWPMAGSVGDPDGNAKRNLWAAHGPLDKFDAYLRANGKKTGALEHERLPALNWLIGKGEDGHYIPASRVKESDAERTTGLDFNGDGKITAGVQVDFLDEFGAWSPVAIEDLNPVFRVDGDEVPLRKEIEKTDDGIRLRFYAEGTDKEITGDALEYVVYTNPNSDGKVSGSYDASWWGSCDKVALAGILFKEPLRDEVTIDGVTFTKQDMLGLLTVIADSQMDNSDFFGSRFNEQPSTLITKRGRRFTGEGCPANGCNLEDAIRQQGGYTLEGDTMILADPDPDIFGDTIAFEDPLTGETRNLKTKDLGYIRFETKSEMDPREVINTLFSWLEEGKPFAKDEDAGDQVWNASESRLSISSNRVVPNESMDSLKPGFAGPPDPKHETRLYSSDIGDFWISFDEKDRAVNAGWGYGGQDDDFYWRPTEVKNFKGFNPRNPFVKPKLVKKIYDKFMEPIPEQDSISN